MSRKLLTRIVIAPGDAPQPGESFFDRVINLPHPRTGAQTHYYIRSGMLLELNVYNPGEGVWFAGNSVISDGSMYFFTAVDPLFLALPTLESCRGKNDDSEGYFQELEQMFCDLDVSLVAAVRDAVAVVCDSKAADGGVYYRLNTERVLACLQIKVQRTAAALLQHGDGTYNWMDAGALNMYAADIICEYLSHSWATRLRAIYSIPTDSQPVEPLLGKDLNRDSEHIEKKIRLSKKDRERRRSAEVREEQKQQRIRRETAGMKKLSSFFRPKANPSL